MNLIRFFIRSYLISNITPFFIGSQYFDIIYNIKIKFERKIKNETFEV